MPALCHDYDYDYDYARSSEPAATRAPRVAAESQAEEAKDGLLVRCLKRQKELLPPRRLRTRSGGAVRMSDIIKWRSAPVAGS